MSADNYVRWFSDIRVSDVRLVGGKTASLGELYSVLSAQGVRIPNGFALTTDAYRDALTAAKAWEPLHRLLDNLDKRRIEILSKRAAEARDIVYRATGNDEIRRQAVAAYRQLEAEYGPNVAVAVRSSATAEDLPSASFAGQHESFLNVRGAKQGFRGLPPQLRLDFHGSRDLVPYRQRVRSLQSRPLGRRDEDGSRRSCLKWRYVHPRHRVRFS